MRIAPAHDGRRVHAANENGGARAPPFSFAEVVL
jgi:hypothetical protein